MSMRRGSLRRTGGGDNSKKVIQSEQQRRLNEARVKLTKGIRFFTSELTLTEACSLAICPKLNLSSGKSSSPSGGGTGCGAVTGPANESKQNASVNGNSIIGSEAVTDVVSNQPDCKRNGNGKTNTNSKASSNSRNRQKLLALFRRCNEAYHSIEQAYSMAPMLDPTNNSMSSSCHANDAAALKPLKPMKSLQSKLLVQGNGVSGSSVGQRERQRQQQQQQQPQSLCSKLNAHSNSNGNGNGNSNSSSHSAPLCKNPSKEEATAIPAAAQHFLAALNAQTVTTKKSNNSTATAAAVKPKCPPQPAPPPDAAQHFLSALNARKKNKPQPAPPPTTTTDKSDFVAVYTATAHPKRPRSPIGHHPPAKRTTSQMSAKPPEKKPRQHSPPPPTPPQSPSLPRPRKRKLSTATPPPPPPPLAKQQPPRQRSDAAGSFSADDSPALPADAPGHAGKPSADSAAPLPHRSREDSSPPPEARTRTRRTPPPPPHTLPRFDAGDDVYVDWKDGKKYEAIVRSVHRVEEAAAAAVVESPGRRGARNRGGSGGGGGVRVLSYTVEFDNGEVEDVPAEDVSDRLQDSD